MKEDPIEKARKDLERIVRDSNRNIKRAKRIIEGLKRREYISSQSKKLSLSGKIDYDIMAKNAVLFGIYPTLKAARESIDVLKVTCRKEGVEDNEDLIMGYRGNKFTRTCLGKDERLENSVKTYISLINN